ncbi:MAG: ATP-binding protein, partial [Campylobacterales bacterium]|nr:ATP-binding protein [Campylobacterales bacterium]
MHPKTIAIASGKGGTGKTTISANLAHLLVERGHAVVLADVDVEEPNIFLFLRPNAVHVTVATKSRPSWDQAACVMCGACVSHCHFNALLALPYEILVFPQLCHSCFSCSELCKTGALPMIEERIGEIQRGECEGLVVVEGRLDVGQEMATPLIHQTLREAKHHAKEMLICDAPPGTSCSFVETARQSDYVVLVTEPTAFGLNDLTIAVKTVRALGKPFGVVINRVGMGGDAVEAYCEREGIAVIARFLHDKGVARQYALGKLAAQSVPHFQASLDVLA